MDQYKDTSEQTENHPAQAGMDHIRSTADALAVLRDDPTVPDEVYVQMRRDLSEEVGRLATEYGPDGLPGDIPDLP